MILSCRRAMRSSVIEQQEGKPDNIAEVLHLHKGRFSDFEVGDIVHLNGFFYGSEELNGKRGEICGPFLPQCGRFPVRLSISNLHIVIMVMVENMVHVEEEGSTSTSKQRVWPSSHPNSGPFSALLYNQTLRCRSECGYNGNCAVYRSALDKFSAVVSSFDNTRNRTKPAYQFYRSKAGKLTARVWLFGFSATGRPSTSRRVAREYAAEAYLAGHFTKMPPTSKGVCSLDCEMVEVEGRFSSLARVSVVGFDGTVLLDTYCQPQGKATSYRTSWSGIRPEDLVGAPEFWIVRSAVRNLISGKVVVGHGLDSDLAALKYRHPKHLLRDSAKYPRLMRRSGAGIVCANSLQVLASSELGCKIQDGEHCPIEDALAALLLYKKHKKSWDQWAEGIYAREEVLRMLTIFRVTGRVY